MVQRRTNRGNMIDMDALMLKNEEELALGNMKVNARGDKIGPGGKIIKSKEEAGREYYDSNPKAVVKSSIKVDNELDTPAKIVLNPATEYVRKFTEEVPREKVLLIEDVMDSSTGGNVSDLKVSKDEVIENVAEKILTQEKTVTVIDKNNQIIKKKIKL